MLVVRPDAKSPAATKQVNFIIATRIRKNRSSPRARIPTIAGEVSVLLCLGSRRRLPRKSIRRCDFDVMQNQKHAELRRQTEAAGTRI